MSKEDFTIKIKTEGVEEATKDLERLSLALHQHRPWILTARMAIVMAFIVAMVQVCGQG